MTCWGLSKKLTFAKQFNKMKKLFFITTLLTISSLANSQAEPILKSKKGIYIHPQTGDWGIGTSVNPFFSYIGSMFTNNNVVPGLDFQNLNIKRFIDEKNAQRAGIMLKSNYHRERIVVNNLDPNAEPGSTVNDHLTQYEFNITLTYGIEKRRGSGRLQGIYGVEGLLGYGTGSKTKFKYGNSMEHYAGSIGNNRPLTIAATPYTFSIGAQGFLGFEFFFAPKISIGGEAVLNATYTFGGQNINKSEVWDPVALNSNTVTTSLNNRTGDINFGLINWSNLRLMFYF